MHLRFLAAALALSTLTCGPSTGNPGATISIDVDRPGASISPTMYGVFFEDINHAADGGLYAELIQNRDFEYNRPPEDMRWIDDSTVVNPNGWKERYRRPDDLHAWSLIQEGGNAGRMQLTNEEPLNAANPQSLTLVITRPGKGRVGVANEGYWGIPVRKGASYRLVFYARTDGSFSNALTATLESTSGQPYAIGVFSGLTRQWKRFAATLTSDAEDPRARFVLSAGGPGKVWLDVVSLFPKDTWKGRPNGLRDDLVRMLADLRPSFVRFPGGCVVEGATLENRIQWKRTIGDVAARPGHWNLWGYRATDGLGFHEFLQLCEDLHAVPLYVINVGMSCQGRGGMVAARDKIGAYLQEALDALEYAMGPVTSRWGALRAANGHPEPFPIGYVEIGNENGGPDYQKAYKVIQSGIKRVYPGVTTIADERIRLTAEDRQQYPGVSLEMVDEHFYASPTFFYDVSARYDAYDRSESPGIYVGEFAVTSGDAGTGNLRAALGESAFLVGSERNADLVRMASYAPTFVHVRDRRWNPNMIVFNAAQVYGTPSYHALKMFSLNRPDRILPTAVTVPVDSTVPRTGHMRGGIALSAWNTRAEFADVRVEKEGRVVFQDDFFSGTGKWAILRDRWVAGTGTLRNLNTVTEAIVAAGDSGWTDYSLSVRARKLGGEEGFILYVLRNGGNQCLWNIGGWGNTVDVLMQDREAERLDLGKRLECRVETRRWYDLRIEVRAGRIRCFRDGELVHDQRLREAFVPAIYATAGICERQGEVILKIVNPFPEKKTCRVELRNAPGVQAEGTALVLTSDSPADENSFEQPERVVPRSTALRDIGPSFDYACPPHSLSIVTLRLKR